MNTGFGICVVRTRQARSPHLCPRAALGMEGKTGGRALFPPVKKPMSAGQRPYIIGLDPPARGEHRLALHCVALPSHHHVEAIFTAETHGAAGGREGRGRWGLNLGLKQDHSCMLTIPNIFNFFKKAGFFSSQAGEVWFFSPRQLRCKGQSAALLRWQHRQHSEGKTSANSHK